MSKSGNEGEEEPEVVALCITIMMEHQSSTKDDPPSSPSFSASKNGRAGGILGDGDFSPTCAVKQNNDYVAETESGADVAASTKTVSPTETSTLIVAAQLVNSEEEANLGAGDNHDPTPWERKVQEEVELRILRHQNNAVVAEPMDSSNGSITSTEHADRKMFGLKPKIWFSIILVGLILVVAVVTAVVLTTKNQGRSLPCTRTLYITTQES